MAIRERLIGVAGVLVGNVLIESEWHKIVLRIGKVIVGKTCIV